MLGSGGTIVSGEEQEDDVLVRETDEEKDEKACERQMRLAAVTIQAPEPFDVVIVADHSGSLSWSRDDLASGLQTLLAEVRGHDARIFVLTPTQYGASSRAARSPYNGRDPVVWEDPATLAPYEHAMTEYSQVCRDAAGQPIVCPESLQDLAFNYTISGTWSFAMPPPIAVLTPDMDQAAVDLQGQAVAAAILGLGTGGASEEQPLCTLHRYLLQEPALLPKHAVFLLLSDEDDTSDPARCLLSLHNTITVDGTQRIFEMRGSGMHSQRRFNCTALGDQGQLVGEPVPQLWNLGPCTAPRACTASEEQQSQSECPVGYLMSDCTITCMEQTVVACRVEESSEVTDACNRAFTEEGQSFQNLLAYCQQKYSQAETWGECTNYEKDGALRQDLVLSPLVSGTEAEIGPSFLEQADQVFGPDGYSVELIGFDPSFSCTPQAGQSYATRLATLVDSPEHLFPLCEDYSGALAKVRDFAGELIENRYLLDLAEDEELGAVRVLGADELGRELEPDQYLFDASTGMLEIQSEALRPTDRGIDVDVLQPCVVR